MKNMLVFLLLISITKVDAQEYKRIIPFKYQDKWGIVDSNNLEVVPPTYNNVNIFQNFTYAEFDQKDLYNLQTGEKYMAFGKYCSSLKIQNETYHLFTTSGKSALINLDKKDTIFFSLEYRHMQVIELFNTNGEKSSTFVLADLTDGKFLFLKNSNVLNTLIPKRFTSEEIEFITNRQDEMIGVAVKKDGHFVFYDHNLKIIKKIVADKQVRYYQLLTSDISKKLPEIYQMEDAREGCFNCGEVWDDSWDIESKLLNTIAIKNNELDYYIRSTPFRYYNNLK